MTQFIAHASTCIEAICSALPLEAVADHFATTSLSTRLPPALAPEVAAKRTSPVEAGQLRGGDRVRVALAGAARVVLEGEEGEAAVAAVHHCMGNSRSAHCELPPSWHAARAGGAGGGGEKEEEEEAAPGVLDFPVECGEALEALLRAEEGGEGVCAEDLPGVPGDCEVSTLELAQCLLAVGVLVRV